MNTITSRFQMFPKIRTGITVLIMAALSSVFVMPTQAGDRYYRHYDRDCDKPRYYGHYDHHPRHYDSHRYHRSHDHRRHRDRCDDDNDGLKIAAAAIFIGALIHMSQDRHRDDHRYHRSYRYGR